MSGRRTIAAGLMLSAVVGQLMAGGAVAERAPSRSHAEKDVTATASVTLDRLSVKMLGVDRPWNPHICIGCDVNNGMPPGRASRLRWR